MSIVNDLKASKLFGGLSGPELSKVAGICKTRKFENGQMIFDQGSEAGGFFTIASGSVKVFQLSPDGKEHLLHTFNATESFGEAAAFGMGVFPANASAVGRTELVVVPIKEFKELLRKDTEVAVKMIAGLSMLLHTLVEQIHSLTLKDTTVRTAEYLLSLAGKEAKESAIIDLPVRKGELAAQLGMKQETLSRSLKRLRSKKMIAVEGSRITLKNIEALKDLIATTA